MTGLLRDVREMFLEQAEYRELLYRFAARDILVRYKQTVMGFGWAVFMPVINTVVFSIIFTRVAPIATPVPYPLYAYCGLSAWNLFASSLRFSRQLAHRESRPRDQGLLPARDVPVLGDRRLPRGFRGLVDHPRRAHGVLSGRADRHHPVPAGGDRSCT